ncbi:Glutamate-1-semialdehyde 2,1-aminomutase [compost metagenome]
MLVSKHKNQIAALIIEPVVGNMGCVLPQEGYLQALRDICTKEGIVYIFDEVMTGFRLAPGGAQERFGILPDLTTMGKIIGGGMPVGAYGGKKEIMQMVAPSGPMYQAGTLSGNPIAMSAGLAMLKHLKKHPEVYTQLEETGQYIAAGLQKSLAELGLDHTVNQIGSMYSLFFTKEKVVDYHTAKTADTGKFGKYFHGMLQRGVYLAPSQFESLFLSSKIDRKLANKILRASHNTLASLQEA